MSWPKTVKTGLVNACAWSAFLWLPLQKSSRLGDLAESCVHLRNGLTGAACALDHFNLNNLEGA